jgi:hypothetical protein
MWDFVMDKSGTGAGFLRELRFPLPNYIPSASPQSSSISPEASTTGQEWHKPNNNNNNNTLNIYLRFIYSILMYQSAVMTSIKWLPQ